MSKKVVILIVIAVIIAVGVSIWFATRPTYRNAQELEEAINRGVNVVGKTAKVKVRDVKEDVLLGLYKYNYIAGSHLNLVANYNYKLKPGDTIKIEITDVTSLGDIHIVTFAA